MTRSETIRAAALVAAFAAVLTASSCASPVNKATDSVDPEQNHPITVAPTFKDLKLSFATPAAGLTPEDDARFTQFVQRYLAFGNGSISISAPKRPDSSAAIRYFGERLAGMGVPRDHILVGTRDLVDGDARIELGFITYDARTAPCGDWSHNAADTSSNMTMPNFGCATQHNLAAMVADPRDLVAPRALGPADATRRAVVMQNYEKGAPTASQKTADQSSNVSGVQ